jgi:hypothetical protein
MGVLDIEQIPPNVPLHKLFFCFMKNGAGAHKVLPDSVG